MKEFSGNSRKSVVSLIAIITLIIFAGCGPTKPDEPAPAASFTADKTSGYFSLSVKFSDQSSGEIDSYYWDFGDGHTSSSSNPSHTYSNCGNYTVSLTVAGPGGTDTYSRDDYIRVQSKKEAVFSNEKYVPYNEYQKIDLLADLTVYGYAGRTLCLGGYWFKKSGDSYYYQYSNCQSNVYKDYLGHQWLLPIKENEVNHSGIGFSTPYSCFPCRTGSYYGRIKLYDANIVGIDANTESITRTNYVKITWNSTQKYNGDYQPFTVEFLSDEESERLDAEIQASGGIKDPIS